MGLRFCRWCRLPMAVTISRDLGSLAFLSPRSICAAWSGCRGWCGSSPGEGSRDDEDGYSSRRRSVFRSDRGAAPSPAEIPVFISPLGNQVEVVIRGVHHVDPARVRGVGVKNGAALVLVEHAGPLALRHAGIALRVIVRGRAALELLRSERHVQIMIEVVSSEETHLKLHPILSGNARSS